MSKPLVTVCILVDSKVPDVRSATENVLAQEFTAWVILVVDTSVSVYPKMAFGRPISEMEPFARPREMEGT